MKPRKLGKRRRLILKWVLVNAFLTAAIAACFILGQREPEDVPAAGARITGLTSVLTKTVEGDEVPLRFEDVTAATGIDFHHMPAPRESLLPEDMGSGVACGDYDGDGYTDIFLVNFAGSVKPGSSLDGRRGSARLFRNMEGKRFADATDAAGLRHVGYGMGAAWGDFDGDGDLDLYITAYGDNCLYENRGDGTFQDVTSRSGVQDRRFSAGCSWADYDRDGDLDLYVCNYVEFQFQGRTGTGANRRQYATEVPYTLNPSSYRPQPNALFRNRGDGTFEDVAIQAGVENADGRSLSASWVDMDGDGWADLYVANDVSRNGVYRNRGNGTFEDIGAVSLAADYRGAMGIAVGDFDNDLDQDIFITHWIAQENALYQNMIRDGAEPGGQEAGKLWYMDVADLRGFGQISLDMIGWAAGFCDFNNDGLRELWLLNGSTFEEIRDHRRLRPQRPFLFWNRGKRGFVEVGEKASPALARPIVGRGGARLDFNRDGLPDLLILEHGGPAVLLQNTSESCGNWIRLKLRQTGGNTQALGARAHVTAGGRCQMAEVGSSSSYLSQDEMTLHFGVGDARKIDRIRIWWPDGTEEIHREIPVNRELELVHPARYPVEPAAISDSSGGKNLSG